MPFLFRFIANVVLLQSQTKQKAFSRNWIKHRQLLREYEVIAIDFIEINL